MKSSSLYPKNRRKFSTAEICQHSVLNKHLNQSPVNSSPWQSLLPPTFNTVSLGLSIVARSFLRLSMQLQIEKAHDKNSINTAFSVFSNKI